MGGLISVMNNEHFSEDEAQQILHLATHDAVSRSMTKEQLVQAAAEMGISPDAIDRAAAKILAEREENQDRLQYVRQKRKGLYSDLFSYLSVNSVCLVIWLMTGKEYFWPGWVIGPWGLFLAFDIIQTLLKIPDEDEFQKWRRRRQSENSQDEGVEVSGPKVIIGVNYSGKRDSEKENRREKQSH